MEVFKRNIFVHPFHEDDPVGPRASVIGADNVLFGSDFPHPEGMSDPISFVDDLDGLPAGGQGQGHGRQPLPPHERRLAPMTFPGTFARERPDHPAVVMAGIGRHAHLPGARRALQPAGAALARAGPAPRRPRRHPAPQPPALLRGGVGGPAVGPLLHAGQLAPHRARGRLHRRRLRGALGRHVDRPGRPRHRHRAGDRAGDRWRPRRLGALRGRRRRAADHPAGRGAGGPGDVLLVGHHRAAEGDPVPAPRPHRARRAPARAVRQPDHQPAATTSTSPRRRCTTRPRWSSRRWPTAWAAPRWCWSGGIPTACLEAIERYRVTTAQFVPTMFVRLLKLPPEVRERYDVSSLRLVSHAAAPCPVEVKRQIIEWLGPIVWEYYAGSENVGLHDGRPRGVARPPRLGRAAADDHRAHLRRRPQRAARSARSATSGSRRRARPSSTTATRTRRPRAGARRAGSTSATSATSTTRATSTSPIARASRSSAAA